MSHGEDDTGVDDGLYSDDDGSDDVVESGDPPQSNPPEQPRSTIVERPDVHFPPEGVDPAILQAILHDLYNGDSGNAYGERPAQGDPIFLASPPEPLPSATNMVVPSEDFLNSCTIRFQFDSATTPVPQEGDDSADDENGEPPSNEHEGKCNICLEKYVDGIWIRRLPCFHLFHCDCVDRWLIEHRASCPLCRMAVAEERFLRRRRRSIPAGPEAFFGQLGGVGGAGGMGGGPNLNQVVYTPPGPCCPWMNKIVLMCVGGPTDGHHRERAERIAKGWWVACLNLVFFVGLCLVLSLYVATACVCGADALTAGPDPVPSSGCGALAWTSGLGVVVLSALMIFCCCTGGCLGTALVTRMWVNSPGCDGVARCCCADDSARQGLSYYAFMIIFIFAFAILSSVAGMATAILGKETLTAILVGIGALLVAIDLVLLIGGMIVAGSCCCMRYCVEFRQRRGLVYRAVE